jgi:hypothetical protein
VLNNVVTKGGNYEVLNCILIYHLAKLAEVSGGVIAIEYTSSVVVLDNRGVLGLKMIICGSKIGLAIGSATGSTLLVSGVTGKTGRCERGNVLPLVTGSGNFLGVGVKLLATACAANYVVDAAVNVTGGVNNIGLKRLACGVSGCIDGGIALSLLTNRTYLIIGKSILGTGGLKSHKCIIVVTLSRKNLNLLKIALGIKAGSSLAAVLGAGGSYCLNVEVVSVLLLTSRNCENRHKNQCYEKHGGQNSLEIAVFHILLL